MDYQEDHNHVRHNEGEEVGNQTEIYEMCRNYLRSRAKTGKSVQDPYSRNLKPVSSCGIC
jgi:hypothetical protein